MKNIHKHIIIFVKMRLQMLNQIIIFVVVVQQSLIFGVVHQILIFVVVGVQ